MTPSEIAANESIINSYKYSILEAFCLKANKVSNILKESNDTREIQNAIQQIQLAEAFVQIVIDYTVSTLEGDSNFFTTDEFADIQRHLNTLFNTYYWLELN